jgi:PHD/YefM family antitoxin component YafN of YafNO toxin-antitoxin module
MEMHMEPLVVGIREFRERLADFLLKGRRPVTVTRHGATVGYFIPARATRQDLDRAALKEAAMQMDAMLKHAQVTADEIDDISKDFRSWRKSERK